MFFIKFLKNPKIAKNNENKKIGLLNIFASFLAFQHRIKRIKIFKDLWNSSTFKALFLKSLILFIRVDVNKKIQKNKKNQIYKKKKKLRDQVWKPTNIFTYKCRSPQHTHRG
jgi:hypothetical protein